MLAPQIRYARRPIQTCTGNNASYPIWINHPDRYRYDIQYCRGMKRMSQWLRRSPHRDIL